MRLIDRPGSPGIVPDRPINVMHPSGIVSDGPFSEMRLSGRVPDEPMNVMHPSGTMTDDALT
jgi:hypothetical protein